MTNAEAITAGTQVRFRDDFSPALVGIVFEVVPFEGGKIVRHAAEGYDFVHIRTRVGKAQRWAYRHAKVADLVAARVA